MATPPPVTANETQAAIDRITERRRQVDDPNAWRLSDDPPEVLVYLRRYSQGMPRWVAEADVLDGLTLRVRLWWTGIEAELWLLERARKLEVPPRAVGQRLGVLTRQAVHDRLRLAREKVGRLVGVPHPALDARRDGGEQDPERIWLRDHQGEILAVAADALAYRKLADDEAADWLADVARDVRERVVSPGSVQTLRFALVELSASTAVRHLAPEHPLQELLLRWSGLYSTRPGR